MTHTPKKSLGQNFLQDMDVVRHIIDAAALTKDDVVIEVGPGEGVLTQKLVACAGHVVAIEIDQHLLPPLEKKFKDEKKITLVHGDVQRINIAAIVEAFPTKNQNYKVVANLPYYITSPIIRLFLESNTPPTEMIIMVQKEVAERITAEPGAMSILAVAVQYYGTPQYLFSVPKESFTPIPKVQSAVIKITYTQQGAAMDPVITTNFFRVVRAGFSARRKTLANNLANSLQSEKKEIEALLAKHDLAPNVRAQELSVDQWKALATELT